MEPDQELAATYMARERPGHTLDATALVHEVFLKLGGERSFASKSDFMQAAAEAMRRILVDHARARIAVKRGAGRRVEFDPEQLMAQPANEDLLDRPVALKVPNRRLFETGVSMEAFLVEARTAAKLKHPGLVAVHDVQMEQDLPFIVQELIEGSNLADWAKSHCPSREQIVRLMIETVEAVGFAHRQGFVHRDLKPANILVDGEGYPHVADFGLAVHETVQRERQGEVSGTPAYMPPEQVRGETHRLDGRSDLWSLGVILHELLAGKRPFQGKHRPELFDEICTRDPRPPRQLDPTIPKLERICLKGLQKRATDRYASATDFADDLRHWLEKPETGGGRPGRERVEPHSDSVRIVPKGCVRSTSTTPIFF